MAARLTELSKSIEGVLLRPAPSEEEIADFCRLAVRLHLAGVCVAPMHVASAARHLRGSDVRLVAMIGFPWGDDLPTTKAVACEAAVADGAEEVEVTLSIATLAHGDPRQARAELRAVQEVLRVRALQRGRDFGIRAVLELGHLDVARQRLAARIADSADVSMVVTSTGMSPRRASTLDVSLLREELGDRIGIKAAGGVRTLEEIAELVAAGASRVAVTNVGALVARGG